MSEADSKPLVYRDPSIVRKLDRDAIDRSVRRAYEALLQEPVPEELTKIAKSLNRSGKR